MRLINLISILCLTFSGSTIRAESSAELAEIWEASRIFSQPVNGPLSIQILNGRADGYIANLRAHAVIKKGWFTLDFGSKNGRFKGKVANNKKQLEGHWIQPASGNRVFVPYATPVRFNLRGGTFEGYVEALENRMTQYLILGEKSENGRKVTFINPEQNRGRLLKTALLKIENDNAIIMGQLRWQKEMQEFATGRFDKENQVLSLYIPFLGGSYDFKPAGKNSTYWAKGKDNHYRYRQPDSVEGDWPTSTPEDVGVSREKLTALVQQIIDKPIVDTAQGSVHAVLVAREGKLILEEYFSGFDRTSLHDTRSASKSLTGSLIGLAQQAGVPVKLEDRLYSVLTDRYPELQQTGLKSRINLQHVLSMSTGLDCNDNDDESPGNEDRMQNQQQENDWFRYLLKLDAINEPGTKPAYCSAGINMAGAMLAEKSGEWLPTNIEKYFAKPLGIDRYHINMMPGGNEAYSGGGIRLRARDFMKLGQLMLDNGQWQGKQLIASKYVAEALSPLKTMFGQQYGLGWWQKSYEVDGKQRNVFYAGGNGGQQIIVDIESGLLIVFYGGAYSTRGSYYARDELTPQYLLNAVDLDHR